MRKILILAVFLSLLFFPSFVSAQNSPNQNVVLPAAETVNRDYFASGNTVTLSGTVNGDAYIAAGTVIVDGTINGDLLAAGGMVDIRGRVAGNVRAAGGQLTSSGEVGRNLSLVGGSINITDPGRVTGSLAAAGGNINISAPVEKDVNVASGQVFLNNSVGGNVTAAGQVSLSPTARVGGDLNYWSTNKAQISSGATIGGKVTQNIPPQPQKDQAEGAAKFLGGFKLASLLAFLVSYLVVGLLMVKFLPYFTGRITDAVTNRFWGSLGRGVIIAIVVPIIALILGLTLLGIPLALIVIALYLIAIFLTKVLVSLAIGQKILGTKAPTYWGLMLGLAIYGILNLIPLIGWLVDLVVVFVGLGALYIERRDFMSQIRAKKLM